MEWFNWIGVELSDHFSLHCPGEITVYRGCGNHVENFRLGGNECTMLDGMADDLPAGKGNSNPLQSWDFVEIFLERFGNGDK